MAPEPVCRRPFLRGAAIATTLSGPVWLAACGVGEQKPPPEAKEVTITYLTDWPTVQVRANFLNTNIPKFMAENPKTKVQVDSTMEVAVAGLANAAAGTLEDVMLGAQDLFIQLVKGGGWRDIAPVLKQLKF